jgi:predicted nuclease with TOPRIM domain
LQKKFIIYKRDKCNKEFIKKFNYITHINRKIPCDGINHENNQLLLKVKELEQENNIKQNKIILLEEENKRINELYNNLLDKCIRRTNKNIKIK